MSEEYKTLRQHNIDLEYESILASLKNGRLYGEPIDIESVKELVVSSWYAGNSSAKLPWVNLEKLESELFFDYIEDKARRVR